MGLIRAIKSGFRKYFEFTGTATRPEYWYWLLFNLILAIGAFLVQERVSLQLYQVLLMFIPTLSVTVRRLRDAGYSWAWMLLKVPAIIPFVIGLVQFWIGVVKMQVELGKNIFEGDLDQVSVDMVLARQELSGAITTMVVSLIYMAGSFLLVWGFFTARKSKSFEEGNKRVAPKTPENPVN